MTTFTIKAQYYYRGERVGSSGRNQHIIPMSNNPELTAFRVDPDDSDVEYTPLDRSSLKIPTAHDFERSDDDFDLRLPQTKFLDELRMLKLMQAIITKDHWYAKIKNTETRKRWLEEALEQNIRKDVAEWALKELEWCSSVRDDVSGAEPSGIDHVWKSDKLIDDSLRTCFMHAIKDLRETLPTDCHPGSNDQVLNLVHPSLFCLVYGLSTGKDGNVITQPEWLANIVENQLGYLNRPREHPMLYSHRYQWLPSEFLVDKDYNTKIASYINGLPPHIKGGLEMYSVLGQIFKCTVPLFEQVLSSVVTHHGHNRFPLPSDYELGGWWEGGEPPLIEWKRRQGWNEDPRGSYVAEREWYHNLSVKPSPIPIPEYEKAPMGVQEEDMVRLGGHRLQVIVKIGSIVLTPENPDFNGGNWHLEGMANERIVATAIYYFDSENIQDSRLQFRHVVEVIEEIAQEDDAGAYLMYGITRDDPKVQDAGDIVTPQGRVIVFPNIYQHSVAPFGLKDRKKPGHRSILVFFLVDPTRRITSTAHVPPQDPSWYQSETMDKMARVLPVELQDTVWGDLSQFTRDIAQEHRLKLMEERTYATDQVTQDIFERPFNLCEH